MFLIIAGNSSQGRWHRSWVLEINTQEGVFLSVLSVLEFQHLVQSLGHLPALTTKGGIVWQENGTTQTPAWSPDRMRGTTDGHQGAERKACWPVVTTTGKAICPWTHSVASLAGGAQRTDPQQAESQMLQVRTLGRPSPLDFSVCSSTVTVAGLMGSPGSIRPQALPSGLSWLPTLGLEDGQPNCLVLRNTRQLTHNFTGI